MDQDHDDSEKELQKANDEELSLSGCNHYKRRCRLVAPCCQKEYPCRICHDEAENHEMDRFKVVSIACINCNEVQKKHEKCIKCDTEFGRYFCAICSLFDDADKKQFHCQGCGLCRYFCAICSLFDDADKKQFHCQGCGLCRVGGRENFFHCEKCDMCLAVDLKNHHKCIEKSSHSNCAVCLENLHSSRIQAHIPHCGHLIHRSCFKQMVKTGNYACPTCGESMVEMKEVWEHLDDEIANCPMPEEYKDYHVQILCKDCHKESNVLFHVLGLKCQKCGSYNTCRAAEPEGGAAGDEQSTDTDTAEADTEEGDNSKS